MTEVTKIFNVAIGHRLACYDGLCKNMHGHNFSIEVTARGEVQEGGADSGMVIDFSKLKKTCNKLFDAFDHASIFYSGDTEIIEFWKKQNWKLQVMEVEPTAENLAEYFFNELDRLFRTEGYNAVISKVAVWETPTSKAVFS